VEKQYVLHIVSLCVALGIQHAMRMYHIIICGPPRYTILFPHYLINGTIFEKVVEQKMYVFISATISSETFLILRRNESDMIQNV
jgi:hypothetical protein